LGKSRIKPKLRADLVGDCFAGTFFGQLEKEEIKNTRIQERELKKVLEK
jgi:hypothetical protein